MKDRQLIFVYNANSGLFSTVSDFAHKILSRATYSCTLCALTYGNFSVKQEWKSFIQGLPVKSIFLHKDEFEKRFKIQVGLPAIFMATNSDIEKIIDKREIESSHSLEELKKLVVQKLETYVQHHHSNL
jgi:hypothetical protein